VRRLNCSRNTERLNRSASQQMCSRDRVQLQQKLQHAHRRKLFQPRTRTGERTATTSCYSLGAETSCHSDSEGVQRTPTTTMRQVLHGVQLQQLGRPLPPDDAPRSVRMRLNATESETRVEHRGGGTGRPPGRWIPRNRCRSRVTSAHIRRSKRSRLASVAGRHFSASRIYARGRHRLSRARTARCGGWRRTTMAAS